MKKFREKHLLCNNSYYKRYKKRMRSFILKCTICIGLLCSSLLTFSQDDWDECEDSHGINVCYKQNNPLCPDPPDGSYVVKVSGIPPTANDIVVILYNFDTKEYEKKNIPTGMSTCVVTFSNLAFNNLYHPLVNIDGIAKWEGMSFQLKVPEYSAKLTKEREAGCTGQPVGVASVEFNAGIGPYTWEWNKKDDASFAKHSNQAQITDMTPGDYFVRVTDQNGCTINSDTLTIATQDISISVTNTKNVSCKDTTDGVIEVAVSGAYGDYNLYWNGDKNHLIDKNALGNNSLAADTYMIQVEDEIGCTDETGPVEITEPAKKIELNLTDFKDLDCKDIPNGQATFSVENANGAVSYLWSDGAGSGSSRNDLAANISYSLTVTDAKGCKATNSVKLSQPDTEVSVSVQDFKEPSCYGYSDGSITVTAIGGNSGVFDYKWNSTLGEATKNNISAGDYEIIAIDGLGCTDTIQFNLEQPNPLDALFTLTGGTAANPNVLPCNGETLSVAISVEGGIPPISYKWFDEDYGTKTSMEVGAGNVNVMIKDGNGCEQPATTTIIEPEKITATISEKTPIKCNGDYGELIVSVTGGTGNYSYNWSTDSKTETSGQVGEGTYSIEVTDEYGCSDNQSYNLKQPETLNAHIVVSEEACKDITQGNITVEVIGGTEPFEYQWNTGATSASIDNLTEIVYKVTVTDQHGCTSIDSVSMTNEKKFTIKPSKSNVTCPGREDGTARIQTVYGETPYTFNWSNGESIQNIKNLAVGTYTVRVTDSRGCEKNATIEIGLMPPMVVTSLTTEPTACSFPTGTATIKVTGGQSKLKYAWTKGSETLSTKNKVEKISEGTYNIQVTDRNGCVLDTSATIEKEANINIAVFSEDTIIHCVNGQSGVAKAIAKNGVEPYQFLWSDGQTTETATNLSAGTYNVTATDADGCDVTTSIKFYEDDVLTIITLEHKDASCFGAADGYLAIDIEGGVAPYTISWSNGPTTYTNQKLAAGTYTVTVEDSKGCSVTQEYTITQPNALTIAIENQTGITCEGDCDASADVIVTGGTMPYTIQWSSGETGSNATALCIGTQQVTVEDAKKCIETISFDVNSTRDRLMVNNTIKKSPICSEIVPSGEITVSPSGSSTGDYFYEWKNDGTIISTANSVTGVEAGAYSLHLTDGTCAFDTTITLSHVLDVTSEFEYIESTCDGESYKLTISNEDIANYSYVWDNGSTTQTATGLDNGLHSVKATDKDGCILTTSLQVEEKYLNSQVSVTDVNCFGKSNGSATVTAENTKGEVHYNWYKKSSDELIGSGTSISGLSKGDYYVEVYDDNHATCADIVDVTINEPVEMQLIIAEEMPSYCQMPNGRIIVEIIGDPILPVTYEWKDNESNILGDKASCTVVPAGVDITITATDAVGCSATKLKQISDISNFSLQIMPTADIKCFGGNDAALEVFTINGEPQFTYAWDGYPDVNSNTLTGLASGTYSVTVTDAKGCKATESYFVPNPQELHVEFDETPRIECKGGTGTLTAVATGGWPSYTYNWYDTNDNILQSSSQSDLNCKKGLYKVKISDKYGCESEVFSYEMTEPDTLTAIFTVDVTECGNNSETGKITIDKISGGWENSPYRYKWGKLSDDKTWFDYDSLETQALTNLPAGTFVCTITYTKDSSECYIEKELFTNPLMPESIETVSQHTRCSYYTDTEIGNGVTDGSIEVTKLIVSKGNYDDSMQSIANIADYTFTWNDAKRQTGPLATHLNTGSYEVTVTGANECSKTFQTDTIDSYVKLDAEIYATEDNTLIRKQICLEDSLNVSATLRPTYDYGYTPTDNTVSYAWSILETNSSATINTPDEPSTWVTPQAQYYADSSQVLFSYSIDGCTSKPVSYTILHYDSVNFAIEMYDTLGVYIGMDSVSGLQGLRYLFMPIDDPWFVDKTGENGVTSILWRSSKPNKMEKGLLADTVTNEKTYTRSGNTGLLIRLEESEYLYATATTIHGCKEHAQIYVDVMSSNFVPSGFSPNGDGINDEWVIPYLNNCPEAKIHIYNRWGVLVYENNVEYKTQPWNGTSMNGSKLPMGTYYYVIEYNDIKNTPTKTGSVSIIR